MREMMGSTRDNTRAIGPAATSGTMHRSSKLLVSTLIVLLGCTRYLQMDDPALRPFQSMYAVNRDQYGMTPLPKQAQVFIERRSGSDVESHGYDLTLHIYGKSFHHIAFRLENGAYKWVGEQEQCWGPKEFDTVNGRFREVLSISYYQNVQYQRNGLRISYDGPDHALSLQEISIPLARKMLKEWGCT